MAGDVATTEPELSELDEQTVASEKDEAVAISSNTSVRKRNLRLTPFAIAALFGGLVVAALVGLLSWFAYHGTQLREADAMNAVYVQAARQGAINLTTIDHAQVEADIARVLDSSTGAFHDDFAQRAQPFVDTVKKVQSKSTGTVTEAGLESETPTEAQVLVAVSVQTSTVAGADPQPRAWRMRIVVQRVGDDVKVSNVEFVP